MKYQKIVLIALPSPKTQPSINSLLFGELSIFWVRAVFGMLGILGSMFILGYFAPSLPSCVEEGQGFYKSSNRAELNL
jgi:hypothetical protein